MRIPDQTVLLGHRGHRHFWKRALSRRQFLEASAAATGAALTSDLWLPVLAQASTGSLAPRPIPGSLTVAGTTFHINLPTPGADQSPITDFNGVVAAAGIHGTGSGLDSSGATLANPFFDVDMRFVDGEYIALDGTNHHGAFGFI